MLCVAGHTKPTVVGLVHYIHLNVCFLKEKDKLCIAILFEEQSLVCSGDFTLTLPSAFYLKNTGALISFSIHSDIEL